MKSDPDRISAKAMVQTKTGRGKQNRCEGCNHVFSFHRNGRSKCTVTNCECPIWVGAGEA